MIYLSFIWILFFFGIGLLLMFMPGRASKALSIFFFAAELPLVSSSQTVWADLPTGPRIVLIPLPQLITGDAFAGMTLFVFLAFLNYLEFDDRTYRPPFKKRKKKPQ